MSISKKFNELKTHDKTPRSIWTNPLHFIAFGFGSGALPYAPGTWGTLASIPLYLLLSLLPNAYYVIAVLIITVASVWLCDKVSRDLNTHDHQGMCIDEFIGFFVTMIYVPREWTWIILGFILFRVFDIWKPQPIRYIDKNVGGGFGMILDDVVAGIFACVLLHLVQWIVNGISY